ncbi:diaminopimelate decarboxylase [Enemella dayhoffiae]|uniref:Diaminopimelate decarboxylase n=1 Tax=Enemella dayhoffiae TaxID=2016507 RepID=A0A255GUM5_9ACTN|nr:diaminopimelate decarboxylase [Enemella dayhoffiae]OYO19340.1 diaminopimelate decarboxylase [Enemella dayhoffiae]
MTHMHVAGSIHADTLTPAPKWLQVPADVNRLETKLWSSTVRRGEDGVLRVGRVAVTEIAEQVGTPAYVIDEVDFRARARAYADAFAGWDVYYAGKSFLAAGVVGWVAEEGLCLDVCSGNELIVALAGGMDPARIGLHGNNKSVAELELAVDSGVGRIIVDSLTEIDRLAEICAQRQKRAKVLVRVTAGVEAHTHEYIATAHEDQKFGLSISGGQALAALRRCAENPHLDLRGIHSHIGSQIFETAGFEVAIRRTLELHKQLAEDTSVTLPELDLGGGFGIAYTSADTPRSPEYLAGALQSLVARECRGLEIEMPHLSIEPGRAISGPPGMALYTVGTVKQVEVAPEAFRCYVSVDGGMSDNIRPALYGSEYSATVADRRSEAGPMLCRVVGKHCESGDILVRDEFLPADIAPGDLIAVPAAGAYSRSMASNYNHALRPPVVSVRDGKVRTLIRRETLADLLGLDPGVDLANLPAVERNDR